MVTEGTRTSLLGRRPLLVDAVAAVALVVGDVVVVPWLPEGTSRSAPEAVLIALALALVPLRNRTPWLALALTTLAAAAAVVAVGGIETFAALAPLFPLYTVALRSDRRWTVLAWAWTAGVLALAGAVGAPPGSVLQESLQVLPWTAVVAAVGDGLRNRRAYLAELEERAVRAERSRDEEALRRVAEERMRIARELHDVVAHHIAVVNVQAGVAQHLISSEPGAAAEALTHVRRSAGTVLEELGDILSVLREPGEPVADSAPAPGLARLEALVGSFAAAGLAVDWSLHGQPRTPAPTVDLVAYRLLEEGLTNALKHGTGTAHLSVDYLPSSVVLRVVNSTRAALVTAGSTLGATAAGSAPAGTGHGLLGMRERASAVGGTLRASPGPGGTFRVEAELPLRESGGS